MVGKGGAEPYAAERECIGNGVAVPDPRGAENDADGQIDSAAVNTCTWPSLI